VAALTVLVDGNACFHWHCHWSADHTKASMSILKKHLFYKLRHLRPEAHRSTPGSIL